MDFVDGSSLAEVLAVYQTLPEEVIAYVTQSVRLNSQIRTLDQLTRVLVHV